MKHAGLGFTVDQAVFYSIGLLMLPGASAAPFQVGKPPWKGVIKLIKDSFFNTSSPFEIPEATPSAWGYTQPLA